MMFNLLIIYNLKDTERANSLQEPTVAGLERAIYVERKNQELVILVINGAISFVMNLTGIMIFLRREERGSGLQ
jgi:hypothetical protein